MLVGSRTIAPARELDPSAFTKIDRLANRTIALPEGEYKIFSRQNPAFVTPAGREGWQDPRRPDDQSAGAVLGELALLDHRPFVIE